MKYDIDCKVNGQLLPSITDDYITAHDEQDAIEKAMDEVERKLTDEGYTVERGRFDIIAMAGDDETVCDDFRATELEEWEMD